MVIALFRHETTLIAKEAKMAKSLSHTIWERKHHVVRILGNTDEQFMENLTRTSRKRQNRSTERS